MKTLAKLRACIDRRIDRADDALHRACDRIAPEKRLAVVLCLLLIFACGSIYITVKAVYQMGREDALRTMPDIEHIRPLDLQHRADTTNHFKQPKDYE